MSSRAERIQAYLRETARRSYEHVQVPPFTAYFHPRDPLRFLNYAIPDEPASGDLTVPLAGLRAVFEERRRVPRFEYVEGYAPLLAPALEAGGFALELRAPLMTCRKDRLAEPPAVPGLVLTSLGPPATEEELRAFVTVRRRAFEGDAVEGATAADAADLRSWLRGGGCAVLACLDGEPVAGASATLPLEGLSEVTGVGVVAEARRRGIGSAVTAGAARAAFASGAELAFLSPGSDEAQSIYARAGFQPEETMLFYLSDRG